MKLTKKQAKKYIKPTERNYEYEMAVTGIVLRTVVGAFLKVFRDECNEGKQFNWDNENQPKFFISYDNYTGEFSVTCNRVLNYFVPFGYFANHNDAELVIREYGSEIKKLFIEVKK